MNPKKIASIVNIGAVGVSTRWKFMREGAYFEACVSFVVPDTLAMRFAQF